MTLFRHNTQPKCGTITVEVSIFNQKMADSLLAALGWKRKTRFSWTPAGQAVSENEYLSENTNFYGILFSNIPLFRHQRVFVFLTEILTALKIGAQIWIRTLFF